MNLTNSRWAAYATAGAASAVTGAHTAEADIHYSGSVNSPFNAAASSTVMKIYNLDNGGALRFAHVRSSAGVNGAAFFRIEGPVSNQFIGVASGGYRYTSKLGPGVNVSGGPFIQAVGFASLAVAGGYTNSQWLDKGTGFIGFKFNGGPGTEYGWARVTMDEGAPGNAFTLVDYAWADPGTPIVTGQTTAVPEAGSLGLLAIGAAGLLLWRRSRVADQQS